MTTRKITILLPETLLERALQCTGMGITPTIRKGLELVAATRVYDRLRQLRGKVPLALDLKRARADRK